MYFEANELFDIIKLEYEKKKQELYNYQKVKNYYTKTIVYAEKTIKKNE